MTLVYACIAPHGSETVPELAGRQLKLFEPTRRGIRSLALEMKQAKPETIVIASPHSLRLGKHIGVILSENSTGTVVEGKRSISLAAKCDRELGGEVVEEAEKKGLPIVAANYGTQEGKLSDLPMDWGTLIPLWFFLKEVRLRSKILIVTPCRGVPLRTNFEFGRVVADIARLRPGRVAFVASSDQAHTHRKDGPYGVDVKASKKYDKMVVEAVREDRLASIMEIDMKLVERAMPDSLWQMTVLAGVLDRIPMQGNLLSYQVPTYYGMLCASFRPKS